MGTRKNFNATFDRDKAEAGEAGRRGGKALYPRPTYCATSSSLSARLEAVGAVLGHGVPSGGRNASEDDLVEEILEEVEEDEEEDNVMGRQADETEEETLVRGVTLTSNAAAVLTESRSQQRGTNIVPWSLQGMRRAPARGVSFDQYAHGIAMLGVVEEEDTGVYPQPCP